MHTFCTYTSVKEVTGYFIELKSPEAYYSKGQEFAGFWVGEAASRLGLKGKVDAKSFERLCNNLHPETGEPLTPITRAERRLAQDHTFGVPKSVSLAYAYTGDERLIEAGRAAGAVAMKELEKMICARVRKNGQNTDRVTGNLVASEHVHLTTRPVDGFPDPHMHFHYVIFNVTFDPVEKRWKAAQMGLTVENTVYLDKVFLSELEKNLRAIGLETIATEKAFELAGFERELIERFSRRTKEIEATAARLGITDPAQKAKLGAMTRERKARSLLMPELREYWFNGLTEQDKTVFKRVETLLQRSRAVDLSEGITFKAEVTLKAAKTSAQFGGQRDFNGETPDWSRRGSLNARTRPVPMAVAEVEITEHDRRAVAFAMKHIYERHSVTTDKKIIAEALSHWNLGRATWRGVQKLVDEMPLLRREFNGRMMVTTKEVLAEENRLVELCLDGKWKHDPLNPLWEIEDEKLNQQQREAVKHILTSRDWVMGIAGKAGTGKTTLMHEVRRGIERGMHKFMALAPSSEASRETLRKEGFKNAETVAKLLVSEKLQAEARGAVWIVDEAGLLSSRQADRLFTLAQKLEARLVLIGDAEQHHSVERGQAFDLLQNFAHLSVAHIEEIVRQKGLLKEIVECVAAHEIERAFKLMKKSGMIVEMSLAERKVALANDYIETITHGKTALVVAPTHAECDDVTDGIRQELKHRKLIEKETNWNILKDLSWTEAQKEDWTRYENGQVVQFNRHVKGFALGERVEVIGTRDGTVRVRSGPAHAAKIKMLPVEESDKFNVYEKAELEICEGELLRITTNSRTADGHRVSNGNQYKVDHVDHQGRLVLENGWKLDRDFPHLEYGYTITSHAAQSKTVDRVIVAQTAKLSYHASDLNQIYVSISRGREGLKFYTDSMVVLQEIVSEVHERPMAMEILHGDKKKQRLAEMFRLETGMKVSAELGTLDTKDLRRQEAAELERLLRKKKALALAM